MQKPAALRSILRWGVPVAIVSVGCKGILGIEDGYLRQGEDAGNHPCVEQCDASTAGGHTGAGGRNGGESGARASGGQNEDARTHVDGSAGCNLRQQPRPPDPASVVTHGGNVEVVAVQSSVDLGDDSPKAISPPARWRTIGFDVDGRCSSEPDLRKNQECHLPSYATGVPDGPRGQDNALGRDIQLVRDTQAEAFSSENYTRAIQAGVATGLLWLRGYNGEPNDDRVSLANLASAAFDSFAKTQGAPEGSVKPKWDGTDAWPVASYTVFNNDLGTPAFVDNNAYVTNGRLVAHFPKIRLRLVVGLSELKNVDLTLEMYGAGVVCDLEKTQIGRWGWGLTNCTLSGRVVADTLINQLSHFPNPADKEANPLCTDSPLYPSFKIAICQLVDVSSFPESTADCDSLSLNANFDTVPGYLGDVFTVEPVEELCDANLPEIWPSRDHCSTLLSTDAGARP